MRASALTILRVAAHEAQPPARHVVRLRGREDLDADVLGARHLQERGRPVAVEREVGVREVVHDHQPVLARELHHLDEEVALDAHGGRVVREREDEQLGLRPGELRRLLQPPEEVSIGGQRNRSQVAVRDDDRVRVDRIGRVRDEGAVAGLQHRQRQVRHAFLGADGGDDLGVRVQLDVVAVAVPLRHRHPQPRDAAGGRVAVVLRILGGLDELVDDVLGRRHVRIAHAEVDHVLAARPRLRLEVVDDGEDVGRQALDPVEIVHPDPPTTAADCPGIIARRPGPCHASDARDRQTWRSVAAAQGVSD